MENNIDPKSVYTDKTLQEKFVKIMDGDEVIAVIIPFFKANNSNVNIKEDTNSINVSQLIREQERGLPEVQDFDENSDAKQRGDFRRRIQDKQFVDVSDGGKSIYMETFVVSPINKI